MRLSVACCSIMALALSACSSTQDAGDESHPLYVGSGIGSQYGNYPEQPDGEMRGPAGERCFVSNWDRPITPELVVRLRSAACESADHPGWMIAREISRTIIPLSESYLQEEHADQE